MYKRIVVILLLAILLAAPAQRITATSEVTPVNGICWMMNEWQGDDFKFHANPDWSVIHWRNNTFIFYCDYDDDRLDGYFVDNDSWNMFSNENKENMSHTFGYFYYTDESGNSINSWEGTWHGEMDFDWNFTGYTNLKGHGVTEGLHAYLMMWYDPATDTYPMAGEIHEVGNEP